MILLVVLVTASTAGADTYTDEIQKYRDARVARLKTDTGWLTVAGLFWLKDGESTFGADAHNAIVLPAGRRAPAHAGAFVHAGGKTRVRALPGTPLVCRGKPVTEMLLRTDEDDSTDVLEMGPLRFFVIVRGGKHAIRMRDLESPQRAGFTGIESYNIQPAYRVAARFEPYSPHKRVPVPNIVGIIDTMMSPGALVFEIDGKPARLDPVLESPDATQLWCIFSDATSGSETYPGGRFLYADMPKDGIVMLDFNKAYNPPCAFTAFATCPLPPLQNDLDVPIRAGEKTYGHH
jgi:hypothetical protein